MPTQVQSLVVPVYEPIISVQANAEVITEAQNISTAVALANRIEFVRQAVTSVASKPESHCFKSDDFEFVDTGAVAFGTPRIWQGDTPWAITQLAAGTLDLQYFNAAHTNNHGCLAIKSTSGTTGIELRKGSIVDVLGIRATRLLSAKCIVMFQNIAAPMKFEIGTQKGTTSIRGANTASVSFFYDPTVNSNWLARTSQTAGASEHLSDTGVAPVAGSFQKLEIQQVEEADITYNFLINDVIKVTKRQSAGTFFIPTGAEVVSMRLAGQVPVFISNERIIVDYVHFDLNSSGR